MDKILSAMGWTTPARWTHGGGAAVYAGARHTDRYEFDGRLCPAADGWRQYDTASDAWYFGVWYNAAIRAVVTYAEGDVYAVVCSSAAAWNAEIAALAAFYGDPPPAFIAIGHDGAVTHYIDPDARPAPLAPAVVALDAAGRVFAWSTPAPGCDGTRPAPWRGCHVDALRDALAALGYDMDGAHGCHIRAAYVEHYNEHERPAAWVGLRDNIDPVVHAAALDVLGAELRVLGLHVEPVTRHDRTVAILVIDTFPAGARLDVAAVGGAL